MGIGGRGDTALHLHDLVVQTMMWGAVGTGNASLFSNCCMGNFGSVPGTIIPTVITVQYSRGTGDGPGSTDTSSCFIMNANSMKRRHPRRGLVYMTPILSPPPLSNYNRHTSRPLTFWPTVVLKPVYPVHKKFEKIKG